MSNAVLLTTDAFSAVEAVDFAVEVESSVMQGLRTFS